jgi:hypothetical protein
MGWKEFAASLFASLVSLGWPVAVVVLVLVLIGKFQAEFAELVGRLRKAKVPGADLDFAARVGEVEESAEQVVVEEEIPEAPPTPRSPTIEPVGTMILAFEMLSTQIVNLYEALRSSKNLPPAPRNRDGIIPIGVVLSRLSKTGLISSGAFEVISELRSLRNAVIHNRVIPDAAQATQFLEAADDMRRYIAEQTRKVQGGMFDAALAEDRTPG